VSVNSCNRVQIIGIDCATQPNKIGVAIGEFHSDQLSLDTVFPKFSGWQDLLDCLTTYVHDNPSTLLALDAPLGWPESMGMFLQDHQVGEHIPFEKPRFFSRHTDRFIREKFKHNPLEVGADRIARTAHAALDLLHNLRDKTGLRIPMAWERNTIDTTMAIEVYPAATLLTRRLNTRGYKKPASFIAREKLFSRFYKEISLDVSTEQVVETSHGFDAAICTMAALYFLRGECYVPEDEAHAKKEGWIWVRRV